MPILTVLAEQILAPVPGGTGRYARQIIPALHSAAPAGWDVRSVTAWHRDTEAAEIPGVDGPHRLPVGARVLNEAWLRGLPPWPAGDRIHATTPLAPGRRSFRQRSRPLVVTVHDTVPWSHPETLTPRGVVWHRRMIERASGVADYLVVPTSIVFDELAALFPAARSRIRVIGHGATALPLPADADSVAAQLLLPDRYVLSVATMEPRKGLDVLVAAMTSVDADLVLAGQPGWGSLDLHAAARSVGLDERRVHTLGRISDAQLAVAMSRAAVMAVPSRAEGFGLPVLEAMAAGVPVVSSDAPALVEVGAGATVVVPRQDPAALADGLRSVLEDPALAADLVSRGRRRAGDFSWAAAARQLWHLHAG